MFEYIYTNILYGKASPLGEILMNNATMAAYLDIAKILVIVVSILILAIGQILIVIDILKGRTKEWIDIMSCYITLFFAIGCVIVFVMAWPVFMSLLLIMLPAIAAKGCISFLNKRGGK